VRRLFVDTAGWMMLADGADPAHEPSRSARDAWLEESGVFISTDFVLDETLTLLRVRLGLSSAQRWWAQVESSRRLVEVGMAPAEAEPSPPIDGDQRQALGPFETLFFQGAKEGGKVFGRNHENDIDILGFPGILPSGYHNSPVGEIGKVERFQSPIELEKEFAEGDPSHYLLQSRKRATGCSRGLPAASHSGIPSESSSKIRIDSSRGNARSHSSVARRLASPIRDHVSAPPPGGSDPGTLHGTLSSIADPAPPFPSYRLSRRGEGIRVLAQCIFVYIP